MPWLRQARRKRPPAGSPCPPVLGGLFSRWRWSSPPPGLRCGSVRSYGGPLEFRAPSAWPCLHHQPVRRQPDQRRCPPGVAGCSSPPSAWTPERRNAFNLRLAPARQRHRPHAHRGRRVPVGELVLPPMRSTPTWEPTAIDRKRISFPTRQEMEGARPLAPPTLIIAHRRGLGILPVPARRRRHLVSYSFPPSAFKNGKLREGEPDGPSPPNPPTTRTRAARWSPRWPPRHPGEPASGAQCRHLTPYGITPGVRPYGGGQL